MSFKDLFRGITGADDFDEPEYEQGYDTSSSAVTEQEAQSVEPVQTYQQTKREKIMIHPTTSAIAGQNICVLRPKTYEDVMKEAVLALKQNRTVIINLDDVNEGQPTRLRIVDFMAGVCAALEATIQKVAACTYLFAPKNAMVDGDLDAFDDNTTTY